MPIMGRPRDRVPHHSVGFEAELAGGEVQHGTRNDLARLDQTAWIAKREELEAEADAIGGALAAVDQGESLRM
jgi:hypothetical protein